MQDIFHQRFNGCATIAVVPCNDVVHRINFRPLEFWAHVLILLFQSRKTSLVMKRRAPPRQ